MLRLLRHSLPGLSSSAVLCGRHQPNSIRQQSTAAGSLRDHQQSSTLSSAGKADAVSAEKVWALWNEGNLFSLSLVQLQGFLNRAGVRTDASAKKAAVVRQVEEYLHSKDIAVKNGGQTAQNQQQQQQQQGGGYGRWNQSTVMQPETLLDLAQAGFYEGSANMAPKAFQLLVSNTAADVVVSRVNTTAFPGFPANTECYTLSASEKDVAIRSRYSKVLQWCCLNMSNLQMDGELFVDFGKLLLQPSVMRKNRRIVSSFTLQQRMQVSHPYNWVAALPESCIPAIQEELLKPEGFMPLGGKGSQITYSGTIKRAKDQLNLEFNNKGKVLSVNSSWVNVQTAWCTRARGPDVRLLLRSRPQLRRQEIELYAAMPIIQLTDDDVADVLPAEHGQLVYLAEDETRLFEKITEKGVKFIVREVRRQPLIVLRDEEEDPRLEYSLSVAIPANAGKATDVRAVGLAAFELAGKLAGLVTEDYVKEYGCEATL